MASIRTTAPPNLTGLPNVDFDKDLFESAIWQKGYDVAVSKAIECPCRGGNENKALPNCQNCGGIGWVFINPVKTKALITGINRDTKYKPWSQELLGSASMTLRDIDVAGFMDRVTVDNETEIFSEVKKVRKSVDKTFIFLSYEIQDIEDVFIFQGSDKTLIRLAEGDYEINPLNKYSLLIDNTVLALATNDSISVRYKHYVQYHILDIPHALRSSNITNKLGQLEKRKMPNQYIVRLAHYVLKPKADGTGVLDNTYEEV